MKKIDIKKNLNENRVPLLGMGVGIAALGLLFARILAPDSIVLTLVLATGLIASLGFLLFENRRALTTRGAAYGMNSAVTIALVLGILGIVNFVAKRYPQKLDLTRNKLHTLSDQTKKVISNLKDPIKFNFFTTPMGKEKFRTLLDGYKGLNASLEIEYIDPNREKTRTQAAGITKMDTLVLNYRERTSKVEDLTEENLTNAIIKLSQEKKITLCVITGHGEKSIASNDAGGYSQAKKSLEQQAYTVTEISLTTEGKIPPSCDAIAILGPTKSFFKQEVDLINNYLSQGGRTIFSVDLNIKGTEATPELLPILAAWHIKIENALIVDPLSRLFGVDAAVALLASYSPDHAITKSFEEKCFFPLTRPLSPLPGAPANLKIQWLAKSTPKSWGETDLAALKSGKVQQGEGDLAGPVTAAISVEGKKDPQAKKNTRLVIFGTSEFATNNYARFAGNLDFFVNAVSWTLEDENMISIRSKEDAGGRIELSQQAGSLIFVITLIILPLLIAVTGIVIWIRRKKL